jgi:hypothetical protein
VLPTDFVDVMKLFLCDLTSLSVLKSFVEFLIEKNSSIVQRL